jgi:type VI secretion system protein ImpH
MANQSRSAPPAVKNPTAMAEKPYLYGFYQTLRQIEAGHPKAPRFGESVRPSDDVIRLTQKPSLAFANSTLSHFKPLDGKSAAQLGANFFGMFGPNGPLPLHLTEYALERELHHKDQTFARFLDIFHHRLFSLFYRAWADGQPTVCFDRPGEDRFAVYLRTFFGLGLPSLVDRDALPDNAKCHYAGHLANQAKHPEGLLSMVRGYFQAPAQMYEFIGERLALPQRYQCCLGLSKETGTLGRTATLGSTVWEKGQKIRLRIGSLTLVNYEKLLPEGDSLDKLIAMVKLYTNGQFNWDVQLVLLAEEVPKVELGQQGRLGWTTWLGERRSRQDADDLYLNPNRRG